MIENNPQKEAVDEFKERLDALCDILQDHGFQFAILFRGESAAERKMCCVTSGDQQLLRSMLTSTLASMNREEEGRAP